MTVVHPSKKEFVPIPKDFSSKAVEQMQSMGMSITIGGVAVTLDSLPGTDTIAGFPTRHYRTTVSYTMSIEGMGQSQQMKTSATSEYWMASIPGLVASPLQQTGQLGGGSQGLSGASLGPFKDLAAKSDSITRRMSGTAVRTKTTSNSDTGAGAMTLDIGSELSNLKHGADQREPVRRAERLHARCVAVSITPLARPDVDQKRTISSQARLMSSTCGRIASSRRGA